MLQGALFASAVHGMAENHRAELAGTQARRIASDVRTQNESIRGDIERLFVITEALWEFLKAQHGYADEDLVKVIQEIDLRDGKLDGKVARTAAPDCPRCGRKLMSKRPVCLYCGAAVTLGPFEH